MSATVTIRQGKLEGLEHGGLAVFKGIPFAEPPIGARRWLPPEKPASWTGVRDARNYGSAGPQLRGPGGVLAAMIIEEPQSEDCLYLNVWTPKLDGKRRPVMVWIHGGAFRIGSGSQAIYDGANLAQRGDVVVVTINYRIGPFGFLRLTDLTAGKVPATGNEGMLDQIAALEWVRANIAGFGGDPDNVCCFGESAGAMSIADLFAVDSASGLFRRAILQSGAEHAGSLSEAEKLASRFARELGLGSLSRDALQSVP
ncbi:MAG TPA: carboxylesterase family protein, partial [Candidatus Binataceae bacterium]|nr:carboxylesterase family protein [Candidatus Binataceae bacterium]